MTFCKKLTIFEGPDGSGKTTAAQAYAKSTGARYVHFGPMQSVRKSLGRVYVEAMLPALLGYQDVVFDRSWLSEVPYGKAFRNGDDRLGDIQRRMLERLAMRCQTLVVDCRPDWDLVQANYMARREIEMLDTPEQLKQVYDLYGRRGASCLPTLKYDYSKASNIVEFVRVLEGRFRTTSHPLDVASAGDLDAEILIVGENFAEHKEPDPLYQWPFASFNGQGCSMWLTGQLRDAGISEHSLLWVNSDQNVLRLLEYCAVRLIALGQKASDTLTELGLAHNSVHHPQYWKRFHADQPYELIDTIGAIHESTNSN